MEKELKPGDNHYKAYVGPQNQYDFMGATQFRLLTTLGLRSSSKLLDFGCGSLRAGKLFMPYLDANNYFGIEPNAWLIDEAKKNELGADIFELKKPTFNHNSDFTCDMFGTKFDYILAQSIFSHTGNSLLKSALENFFSVLKDDGLVVATFIHGNEDNKENDWVYPGCVKFKPETLSSLIADIGFYKTIIPWYHPRQTWYVLSKNKDRLPSEMMKKHLTGAVLNNKEFIDSIQKSKGEILEQNHPNKRNIIVHTHIFKNAGSSFDDALARNFGDAFIDHREDHLIHKNKDFLNEYINENQYVRAFSSHSVYDKPIDVNNVTYHIAYFVRHPIDRIKSVYSFEYKQPAEDSLGARMAKEFDLKGYVEWRMSPEAPPTIRNMQTIFIAGMGKGNGRMEARYEAALKTLEENPLVALVDRYDESMVVFEDYLREIYPNIDLSYVRRNVTDKAQNVSPEEKAQKLLSDLGEELAKKVIDNNEYDIHLYNKANQLLGEKIKNIVDFEGKLSAFQLRCEKLNNENIDG